MTRPARTLRYLQCCKCVESGGAREFSSVQSVLRINASIFVRLIARKWRRTPVCDPKAAQANKYNSAKELHQRSWLVSLPYDRSPYVKLRKGKRRSLLFLLGTLFKCRPAGLETPCRRSSWPAARCTCSIRFQRRAAGWPDCSLKELDIRGALITSPCCCRCEVRQDCWFLTVSRSTTGLQRLHIRASSIAPEVMRRSKVARCGLRFDERRDRCVTRPVSGVLRIAAYAGVEGCFPARKRH